jgi:hypothetical protein
MGEADLPRRKQHSQLFSRPNHPVRARLLEEPSYRHTASRAREGSRFGDQGDTRRAHPICFRPRIFFGRRSTMSSAVPASPEERLAFLNRHISVLVNQYGVLLHHGSPVVANAAQALSDEARLRAAAFSITTSAAALLRLTGDLRVERLLREEGDGRPDGEAGKGKAAGAPAMEEE